MALLSFNTHSLVIRAVLGKKQQTKFCLKLTAEERVELPGRPTHYSCGSGCVKPLM